MLPSLISRTGIFIHCWRRRQDYIGFSDALVGVIEEIDLRFSGELDNASDTHAFSTDAR
jgi:hypothetical protein